MINLLTKFEVPTFTCSKDRTTAPYLVPVLEYSRDIGRKLLILLTPPVLGWPIGISSRSWDQKN